MAEPLTHIKVTLSACKLIICSEGLQGSDKTFQNVSSLLELYVLIVVLGLYFTPYKFALFHILLELKNAE